MKAQIITGGISGKHNDNFDASCSRVMRGGSWKKQRIIVLLPSAEMIAARVALTHWSLIFPPNNPVHRMLCLGLEVGDAYSQAIEAVLGHPDLSQWEYLLTIETDNMPPADGVINICESMEQHPEFSCIGGLYWTKGEGGCPQIWGDPKDPVLNFRPQVPLDNQLQECCGTGMGFNLWRLSMFKDPKLRRPWFKTLSGKDGFATQDLYAWGDFRKHGYRCAIDCSVKVGHYDAATETVW